MHVQFKDFSNQ